MLTRPSGLTLAGAHENVVMFPWPLRVRATDFRPMDYGLRDMDRSEFGFFEYEPREALDLDLIDRVLSAAADEAGQVDIVGFPEGMLVPSDIEPLEALLAEHGVWFVIAGVREAATGSGQLGSNWVHIGVRQESVWRHARQDKHHRWSLDQHQITQYHLASSLNPGIRWWEGVEVPRRSLQVIEQGVVTVLPLVCEDLARMEPVTDLIRAIAPSLVIALLLDGPQLASRWTSRYASVLADDPGSAVCTLTSYGMVRRCRPPGCPPSRVIALWKDPVRGLCEIELEDGAEAVLITTNVTSGGGYTADGRQHDGSLHVTLAGVHSVHASAQPSSMRPRTRRVADAGVDALPTLEEADVTKATSWAEAIAEAALRSPEELARAMEDSLDVVWRQHLGLPPPSRLFVSSVEALRAALPDHAGAAELASAAARLQRSSARVETMTGTMMKTALEQRVLAEVRSGRLGAESLPTHAPTSVERCGPDPVRPVTG
jgi:hypothetical protein